MWAMINAMEHPIPTDIKLHNQSRQLEVCFENSETFLIPIVILRIFSPSAEAKGHDGIRQWPTGKDNVGIAAIEPVGNYAIKITFDDGHDTGIYSWETLYDLGKNLEQYWQEYREHVPNAG